ncbi:hypothetical protein EDB92DRAFT_1931906 [Lactarius akahatsu]|uniref:Fumarylacetoacetase-like C-terminal domain-containing protein n=1 Tax=Lactarius akahatsu TaxID=416441 RepID=A0AAD4QI65_9AGAM|nr:hypothetical protein EDB92DRAFT_1931906 [Lactarius akahatsu]
MAASFARTGKKIVAIGRNYADHVKELKNAVPNEPFFFLKPTTSYLPSGGLIEIPRGISAHHEVELGLVIGKGGRDISEANAEEHIAGYALAIDMTARNLQEEVKRKGLPWSAVKGFDTFTPISSFIPRSKVADPHNLNLWLKINGQIKQSGNTSNMIFRIPRLIQHISSIMTLEEGDLVLTGTPAGVGPVAAGDKIECALVDPVTRAKVEQIAFGVTNRAAGYLYVP